MGQVKGKTPGATVIHRNCHPTDPGLYPYRELVGTNPRHSRPNYKANLATRRAQAAPCKPSIAARKGPTHREPGVSHEQWCKLLSGR